MGKIMHEWLLLRFALLLLLFGVLLVAAFVARLRDRRGDSPNARVTSARRRPASRGSEALLTHVME